MRSIGGQVDGWWLAGWLSLHGSQESNMDLEPHLRSITCFIKLGLHAQGVAAEL
jgi:hypothetical protein